MPDSNDGKPAEKTYGQINFRCPQDLIGMLERAAQHRKLSVSQYLETLLRDTFQGSEFHGTPEKRPVPETDHHLVRSLYTHQQQMQTQEGAYTFFQEHFPDVLDKMELTAILMRKTAYNDNVIQDLVASLIPEPFDPLALQVILDVYQYTASQLDEKIRAAEKLKLSSVVRRSTQSQVEV